MPGIVRALIGLGQVAHFQGNYEVANKLYNQSLAISRSISDTWSIGYTLNNLGILAYNQGDFNMARALYEESLDLCGEFGEKRGIAHLLTNLGDVAFKQANYLEAQKLHGESLLIFNELKDSDGQAYCLEGIAATLSALGRVINAVRLWACAHMLREHIGVPLIPDYQMETERQIDHIRFILGDDAFSAVWDEGRAMIWEQAVAYALAETL